MDNKNLELLIDNILYVLPLINKKLMKPIVNLLKEEIPPYHFQVLQILLEQGTSTVSEIANILCVSRPNMTPLIDKLIKDGLVSRSSDAKDRRIINISITEEGRKLGLENVQLFKNKLRSKISLLPEEDIKCFLESLENVKNIINKLESQ